MAQNFTIGTIATNFNEDQQAYFQKHAFACQATETGAAESIDEGLALFEAESDDGYSPIIFDQEGQVFWEMENLDIDVAINAIRATFAAFPNAGLEAHIDAAHWCTSPRTGEFGGYNESFYQDKVVRKVIPDSKIVMIWKDPKTGEEAKIPPDYYQESGIPINGNGDNFEYVRTEIEQ